MSIDAKVSQTLSDEGRKRGERRHLVINGIFSFLTRPPLRRDAAEDQVHLACCLCPRSFLQIYFSWPEQSVSFRYLPPFLLSLSHTHTLSLTDTLSLSLSHTHSLSLLAVILKKKKRTLTVSVFPGLKRILILLNPSPVGLLIRIPATVKQQTS